MNIVDRYTAMDYEPAPEARSEADAWLAARDFSKALFINGQWKAAAKARTFATSNPANGPDAADPVTLTSRPRVSAERTIVRSIASLRSPPRAVKGLAHALLIPPTQARHRSRTVCRQCVGGLGGELVETVDSRQPRVTE